ncbi:M13 family metallopeptidase [Williamwhitmania taraxaci]|uniref:Putative endopeptidase n=1 Tax=Williamwhitmania taraxaci TaxID=1640674 RepID=A0A1G6NEP3_9BACT|nr:M13 family metallopeptidase [Williamwhitmania taraxaci]SDC65776.1 putative endopeptidase [Williamwhitmania taraxaci]
MKKHQIINILSLSTLIALAGCGTGEKKPSLAFSPANMDTKVQPGVDFYDYANGTWIKNTPIPGDRARWGAFDMLQQENNVLIKAILEEAATSTSVKGSNLQKVGDFFASGMDTLAIEKAGMSPLKADFDKIDELSTKDQIQKYIAEYHRQGVGSGFNFYVAQDQKNSALMVANMNQGGLGLPDRDYYFGTDSRSQEIRNSYLKYVAKSFELAGRSIADADKIATEIMNFESRLATVSLTRNEQRDPIRTYNKFKAKELEKSAPGLIWSGYFTNLGIQQLDYVIIDNPKFFIELGKMVKEIPVETWKTYFKWNVINAYAPYLSSNFESNHFDFYGKQLTGSDKPRPRWQRIANATNESLGEAVGELYVTKNFPAVAKTKMLDLVANLKTSYKERIQNLPWMSEATKIKAIEKLEKINVKIGYPDKWQDYSSLEIDKSNFLNNVRSGNEFRFNNNLAELGKPVDKLKWEMTPQTVNAYYSSNMNEIVFPAAILRPPFFDVNADDALNYGGIGCVIGHEMTHGFDDQGCLYDKDGNLSEWWTPEDSKKFKALTQMLVVEYGNFVAIDSLHLDGNLTLGENIADYGGLTISYNAYKKIVAKGDQESIDEFTPQQRFFLSYANVWRQGIRDKELMRRVKEDVHSPGKFRVNGALFNIPEFYDAFAIATTDPLYRAPENRPMIW